MRIKLHDVARRTGVSEATVSRVINGKPGVSDDKRTAIIAVLAELGYEPPALRSWPRPRPIGLIVPELDNPIFPAYAQAVEALLADHGFVTTLGCAGRDGVNEGDYLATLGAQAVAGIIVVSGRHAIVDADHHAYHTLVERELPLVVVNGAPDGLGVPAVSCDESVAAEIAVDHLAQLGHQRIGLLTGPTGHLPVVRRIAGYRDALARRPLLGPELIESSMFSVEGGRAGAHRLLDAEATALIAGSDVMALGAIRAVRERGLGVPDDVSVVGYDDTDLMAFTDPPLTTIRQPVAAIASHAVEVLVAQLTDQPFTTTEYLVRPELIARASTAAAQAV